MALAINSRAQEIVKAVTLDELVVRAGIDTLDVGEFIEQVKADTTFYQAFLNMRYFPHDVKGEVTVFNKDESARGKMKRKGRQFLENRHMWVVIDEESTNGNIRKNNGEWKYLTAEMYDELFFPTVPEPASNRIVNMEQELEGGSRLERYKSRLKRFMFNPGAAIETVPFIGDKLAIFDDHMVPYYDYRIFGFTYRDSIECVAFSCKVKEGTDEDDTVIKELTSYFNSQTGQVMKREYHLKYNTLLFDFNIKMEVENTLLGDTLLPREIHYEGEWDMPLKRVEIISFDLYNKNYKVESP